MSRPPHAMLLTASLTACGLWSPAPPRVDPLRVVFHEDATTTTLRFEETPKAFLLEGTLTPMDVPLPSGSTTLEQLVPHVEEVTGLTAHRDASGALAWDHQGRLPFTVEAAPQAP